MVRFRFSRILNMAVCPWLGVVVAACLMISGCAASSAHTLPVATPTCDTTPAPGTTLSIPERIVALSELASCNRLHDLSVTYQQSGEAAQIIGTISGVIPLTSSQISAAQEQVKVLCFQLERALWTSDISLQDVTVTILGPVFDDYYDQVISWYGTADLAAKAAAHVDWRRVSADQAWTSIFARTLLRVDYDSFQLWDATPSASSSVVNS